MVQASGFANIAASLLPGPEIKKPLNIRGFGSARRGVGRGGQVPLFVDGKTDGWLSDRDSTRLKRVSDRRPLLRALTRPGSRRSSCGEPSQHGFGLPENLVANLLGRLFLEAASAQVHLLAIAA